MRQKNSFTYNEMLSIKEGKRILNKNGNKYSDNEVKAILELLTLLARLEVNHLEKNNSE